MPPAEDAPSVNAASASEVRAGPRKPEKRLGDILIELGYTTPDKIEDALSRSRDSHLLMGMKLLKEEVINDTQLAEALSVRFGIGFTKLTGRNDIDPTAVSCVPERMARRYVLIPTKLEGNALTVAMACPTNVFAIDAVRAATGLQVRVEAAPEGTIRKAIDRCYEFGPDLESTLSELTEVEVDEADDLSPDGDDMGQMRDEADDAPVVKYVDSLIGHAIHDRASDIHIEPGRNSVSVRIRVDGHLRQTIAPPKSMQNAVVSRIKILAQLDIAEKRLPLDGRIRVKVKGREVDLRVSTMPTIFGEKVVLRVLDKSAVCKELDDIGADGNFLDVLKVGLARPNGMILVTGPTGSGKSTTLYGCLNYIKDVSKNVISVEDPVEYEMEGITQVPAKASIGMTFALALRAILRQDPDVVMVGEMRDLETLEIGMRASLTGHLVLSSLHTNDSVATISRMINMGAEPYLVSSTLLLAVAQRLVRTICDACKEEYDMPDSVRADIEKRLKVEVTPKLWRGAGCPLCSNTGYYGRTAVFEYFPMDSAAKELVTNNASELELRRYQRESAGGCLLDSALRKALAGLTTIEEAMQLDMAV
jgi:type IV pilus assembly protein PilB